MSQKKIKKYSEEKNSKTGSPRALILIFQHSMPPPTALFLRDQVVTSRSLASAVNGRQQCRSSLGQAMAH